MERKLDDLTIGYAENIDFALLSDHSGHHAPSFELMATPDVSSLVITYTWVDGIAKTFNDKEEAFYIDGVTPENLEKAKEITLDVYALLQEAFKHCSNQLLDMDLLVEEVMQKHTTRH